MRQIMDVNGGVLHSEREYDIAPETVVTVGQVVKLADGLVVPAEAGETGAILGYAAEAHTARNDALNPRADGKRIVVQDAPAAVAESPAPVLEATGGTETTITASGVAAFGADALKGGYVKGPNGHVRRVTASAVADSVLTLTAEAGAAPTAGDKYVLFPPLGFSGGNLSADGRKIVLSATAALPLMVMGRDEVNDTIWTVATKHLLAAGR